MGGWEDGGLGCWVAVEYFDTGVGMKIVSWQDELMRNHLKNIPQ